jgi:hypothetical protein
MPVIPGNKAVDKKMIIGKRGAEEGGESLGVPDPQKNIDPLNCTKCTIPFQELRMAFKMFDKNKDGYIDAKELKVVTTTLGQRLTNEEVEEFMNSADLVSIP